MRWERSKKNTNRDVMCQWTLNLMHVGWKMVKVKMSSNKIHSMWFLVSIPIFFFNQPPSPFNIYSDYEITYLSIIVSSCFEKSFRFITVTTRWPGYPGNPFPPEKLRQEALHYSKQIRGEFLASLICDLRLRFNIPQQLLLL